ncbi:lipoprotein [Burkholderia pseudomallei]|uniref:toxin-antitoxin system YwqK family antitoxin n=1 Tax=Burkholderia pseudomallei TaxID=28450 RepID=UPI000F19E1CC|nr:hypothetical protein [Burkholderia pseudomallei]CAJ5232778.1 lipoprotein [Burkholderia pseudomallei]CAJ7565449.1 lipoprotein [Burkholderia pseudomallei]CAK0348248.1 lipoprotein [Burkholderia pseudomallei]VCH22769.1 lipoprotein [Burkholderia pseudomallei]VCH61675.1 lipoprotein [Burkholderia pseudomallei]
MAGRYFTYPTIKFLNSKKMIKQMTIQIGVSTVLMSLVAVGLTACGGKVDCNSSDVKKDALEIIQSNLNNAVWYNEMKLAITGEPKLENIKTVDTENDGKQAQCRGTYSTTYNEKPRSIDVSYNLAYLEDKKETEVRVIVGDVQAGLMGLVLSERPIKNGEEKIYDTYNQNLVAVRHWNKGLEDGEQEFYDRNTKSLIHQYTVISGKKEGSEKGWGPDRKLTTDLTWKDGKATGFTSIDESGNIGHTITQLKDGLKEGPRKTYSTSHNGEYLAKVENFKNDQLDGLTQQYDEQGKVVFEVLYKQDQLALDDGATARTLNTCVQGWADNYRRTWSTSYSQKEEMDQRISYEQPEWESRCKKGILPPASRQ